MYWYVVLPTQLPSCGAIHCAVVVTVMQAKLLHLIVLKQSPETYMFTAMDPSCSRPHYRVTVGGTSELAGNISGNLCTGPILY